MYRQVVIGDGFILGYRKRFHQSAVESCHTGDTVFVSSGLYNEYVSIVDGSKYFRRI